MIGIEILKGGEINSSIIPGCKGLTLFHDPLWWQVVKEGLDVSCIILKAENKSHVLAFTPFFLLKKGPFKFFGSPLRGTFTPYLGPVWVNGISPDDKLEILKKQQETLLRLGANYIELGTDYSLFSSLGFGEGKNWTEQSIGTFLLKIQPSIESMWKKMESRGRNMVRKAEKNNVTIKELNGEENEIDFFYDMLRLTFQKRGDIPHHPKRFYRSLIERMLPQKRILFLGAEKDGKIIAAGLFPFNNEEIHYLSGASLPEYNQYAPNNLIQWHVIQFAVKNGLKRYDLGGKGIESIDRFKVSMGGEVVSYEKRIWMKPFLKNCIYVFDRTKNWVTRLKVKR